MGKKSQDGDWLQRRAKLTHGAEQDGQVDQRVEVERVRAVLVEVAGDDVVHDEVDGRALPVGPVHAQVPQLVQGEVAVVERVEKQEGEEGEQEAGQQ